MKNLSVNNSNIVRKFQETLKPNCYEFSLQNEHKSAKLLAKFEWKNMNKLFPFYSGINVMFCKTN